MIITGKFSIERYAKKVISQSYLEVNMKVHSSRKHSFSSIWLLALLFFVNKIQLEKFSRKAHEGIFRLRASL